MKLLGSIIALAMVIAALRVAFAVLAMGLVALFLWGLVTNPSRTCAFIGVMLLFNIAGQYPLAVVALIGVLATAATVFGREADQEKKGLDRR